MHMQYVWRFLDLDMERGSGSSMWVVLRLLIAVMAITLPASATRVGSLGGWEKTDSAKVGSMKGRRLAQEGTKSLCEEIVLPNGYPCIEYTVQTVDGFLLGVQNIPHGIDGSENLTASEVRKPVFLQHGLFAGGDTWLINEPKQSLGYILADVGYDVWIGNTRGIEWSNNHVSLSPDDKDFWAWTWDDLAGEDLPAMINFVSTKTGSQLLYVGHSQGTSIILGGLTGTPSAAAMTQQLAGAVLISPIAFMDLISSNFVLAASKLYLDKIWSVHGSEKFDVHNDLGEKLIDLVCSISNVNCADLFAAVTGGNCCINGTRVPYYTDFFPQPTASSNVYHFLQMVRSGAFQKYDYGSDEDNQKAYGQDTPPEYPIANWPDSVPILVLQGGKDDLADPRNIEALVQVLGSRVRKAVVVSNYGHVDFIVSPTANVDCYGFITDFLGSF